MILDYFEWLKVNGKLSGRIVYRNVFQPDYFSSTYLNPEQRDAISKMFKSYIELNSNYQILQDYDLMSMLQSINDILKHPDDYDEVLLERQRLIVAYDKIRNTDTYSMFPYIQHYD
jgi:hypothetical protein